MESDAQLTAARKTRLWLFLAAAFFLASCSSSGRSSEQRSSEDAHWYNQTYLRGIFGDFEKAPSVYVVDERSAASLIARGEYLTNHAAACGSCHNSAAGDPASPLVGGRPMKDRFGLVYAANITPDKETGIGEWNVFELMRALRASIDRDGRPLSLDLHDGYRWMSDQDAKAISVYLLSQKPVQNQVERRTLGGFERNSWGVFSQHSELKGYVPAPMPGDNMHYGRYLTNYVGMCATCHTGSGGALGGTPFAGYGTSASFSGFFSSLGGLLRWLQEDSTASSESLAPYLSDAGKNALTSAPQSGAEMESMYSDAIAQGNFPVIGSDIRGTAETGLATWSEADIVRYLSTGKAPNGESRERRFCPWPFFSGMSLADKQAIARYLKQL